MIGGHPDAVAALEHLPQLCAEAVVQPRVQEGVAAGRAHGAQVAQQLDEQEVALVDEVDVDVPQHVEHVDWQPAHREGRHQQRHQAEDLALAGLLRAGLALRPVAGRDALPQLDRDAQIGHEDGRQRQHVRHQQGAVRVDAPLRLLIQPELLADGEALVFELHVVGVRHGGGHEAAGQQPDAGEHGGASGHRGALLQGVNRCVVPAEKIKVVFN